MHSASPHWLFWPVFGRFLGQYGLPQIMHIAGEGIDPASRPAMTSARAPNRPGQRVVSVGAVASLSHHVSSRTWPSPSHRLMNRATLPSIAGDRIGSPFGSRRWPASHVLAVAVPNAARIDQAMRASSSRFKGGLGLSGSGQYKVGTARAKADVSAVPSAVFVTTGGLRSMEMAPSGGKSPFVTA